LDRDLARGLLRQARPPQAVSIGPATARARPCSHPHRAAPRHAGSPGARAEPAERRGDLKRELVLHRELDGSPPLPRRPAPSATAEPIARNPAADMADNRAYVQPLRSSSWVRRCHRRSALGRWVLLDEMGHQTGDPAWSAIASELDRLVEQAQQLAAGPRPARVTQPLGCVH
jgi:hypothetical protein